MKRITVLTIMFSACMISVLGCKTVTVAQPLAPGYQNAADQTMGEVLAGAHSFYTSIQSQSVAGTITLSATEKQAFNVFGVSLNTADAVYLAYHAGTATQAAAQAAVNTVQSQQAVLPTPAVTQ